MKNVESERGCNECNKSHQCDNDWQDECKCDCDCDCHNEWECPKCHKKCHKNWHKCPWCGYDLHKECC